MRLREQVEQEFQSLPSDADVEVIAQHDAQVNHVLTVNLGYQERLTGAAKAYQLWQASETNFWRSVQIPDIDPDGKPVSGSFRSFKSFEDYFDYICTAWGMTAPASVSVLLNTVIYLLPACSSRLIIDPDTGEYVTPEDVLMLDEHMRQMLVSVANKVLNPKVTKGQPKPIETIGQALSIIHDSGSVTEASTRLQAAKLIGSATGNDDNFTMYTYAEANVVYVGLALDQERYRKLLLILGKKAETASVLGIDGIVQEMKAITPSVEEPENDPAPDDDAAAFTGYLKGQS